MRLDHVGKRGLIASILVGASALTAANGQTPREIAQRSFTSVVLLLMEDSHGQPVSLGSGFFVANGIVATNVHVVEGAAGGYAKLVGKNTKYDIAGTVSVDNTRDLVLLSVTGASAPPLAIGDSSQAAVGDPVYVVGNPRGLEGTFSQGIVSSVRQVGSDTLLQITAPISPGSSGGPVLDAQGKVIGIAVATFRGGQNLNFAIPASYLAPLLANVQDVTSLKGRPRPSESKSILDGLGGRISEAAAGSNFTWTRPANFDFTPETILGDFTFSLRNQLREAIKDVQCLVVFYDRNGEPLDVSVTRCYEFIPGGLAKRIQGTVHGSVQKLTTRTETAIPDAKVEFRVLDFQIAE